jgi:hypothetical protein
MAGRETIPEALAAMVEPGPPGQRGSFRPTLQWYDFLNRLASNLNTSSDQQDEIDDILAEIERIREALTAGIVGPASVRVLGSLSSGAVTLQLVNDVVAPAEGFYYGTDADGTKGWFERLLASLNDVDLAGLANGDTLIWNAGTGKFEPGTPAQPSMFPIVTGEVPPVFVYGPDGSLVYGPVH